MRGYIQVMKDVEDKKYADGNADEIKGTENMEEYKDEQAKDVGNAPDQSQSVVTSQPQSAEIVLVEKSDNLVEKVEKEDTESSDTQEDKPSDSNSSDVSEKVESIDSPAKVMRIGTMLKLLLKQVRSTSLDESSRKRLYDVYELSLIEIGSVLSPDLREELSRLTKPFKTSELTSDIELQIAKAQLVGWLEGLIRGMQAMLFAQELAARRHLETMRAELMPSSGKASFDTPDESQSGQADDRPGAYL